MGSGRASGRVRAYSGVMGKARRLALDSFAGVFKIWNSDADDRIGGADLNRYSTFLYGAPKDVRDSRDLTDAAERRACFTRRSPHMVTA
ncbi:MAG: hypothetical protein AAGB07_09245 [Pseudomonadota bacterium]